MLQSPRVQRKGQMLTMVTEPLLCMVRCAAEAELQRGMTMGKGDVTSILQRASNLEGKSDRGEDEVSYG